MSQPTNHAINLAALEVLECCLKSHAMTGALHMSYELTGEMGQELIG